MAGNRPRTRRSQAKPNLKTTLRAMRAQASERSARSGFYDRELSFFERLLGRGKRK